MTPRSAELSGALGPCYPRGRMGAPMPTDAGRARERRAIVLGRAAVVALAALLRFVGIGFAPSTPWGRPDEEIFADVALRLFSTPNPHTAETGWPELWFRAHYYVQALLRAIWSVRYGVDPNLGCVLALDPSRMIIPVRIVTAALSVGTVWLVMRLGRRVGPRWLSPGQREAISLIAGLFYAVDVLVMRDAHFAVSDQVLLFFLVWMFLAAARGMEEGRLVDFASCGLALGFAIGTKWTGLAFGIVPVIALGIRFRRFGAHPTNIAALLAGTAATIFAFVVTNPTFLTSSQPFLDGIAGQMLRYDPNAPQAFTIYERAPIEFGISRHLRVSLPFAFGYALTLVGVLGTLGSLTVWRKRARPATLLIAFFTLFFHVVVVGRTTMYFARYSLPIHPGMAISAALAVVMFAERFGAWRVRRGSKTPALAMRSAFALAGLLALEPTFRSIELDYYLTFPETRELAMRFVHAHAGTAPVDVSGNYARPYGVPPRLLDRCEEALPPPMRRWVMRLGTVPDPASVVGSRPGSWPAVGDAAIMETLHRPVFHRTSDWLVVAMPYLPCEQAVNQYAVMMPPACYTEVARFEPTGIGCDAVYDDQDHIYSPLWGWEWSALLPGEGEARIGPRVLVFHDDCP